MTDQPKRIQLRRTKGWRKPEGAIFVARPSKWGNPWKVGDYVDAGWDRYLNAAAAVSIYRSVLITGRSRELHPVPLRVTPADAVNELRGHDLACWCPLVDEQGRPVPCHADVLLELANR